MMFKKCKVQNENAIKKSEGAWMSKSVAYIVCGISLERFCTAGILSKLKRNCGRINLFQEVQEIIRKCSCCLT